jgi:LysM repeat protein
MTLLVRLIGGVMLVLLVWGQAGCLPSSQSRLEEEKEPHFLAGKTCINNMDYKGAIEEFEKALEANPHSASAHFQLGWLYEEREPDAAAAIYHYQQYLKLRPNSENAEIIRQHITNCKQDLAKTILPLPVTPSMQHEFEQLAEENKRLRDELDQWRAYATRLQSATNAAIAAATAAPSPVETNPVSPVPAAEAQKPAPQLETRTPASPRTTRTYVVKSGDSPYGIAKRNGVRLEALMAANPGLDPRRLRVGQELNLPQ